MTRPVSTSNALRARPEWRLFIAFALAALVAVSLAGCIRDEDLTLEQRQHQLERELICEVCDGQTLDQSQAEWSRNAKQLIATRLQAGDTNQQIKDFFVTRYGEDVLASPPIQGINLLAWFMPVVITGFGGAIVVFALRSMRRTATVQQASADRSLDPYLAQVDQDLGLGARGGDSNSDGANARG